MQTLKRRVRRFLADQDGATATEYAVMLALILLAVIAVIGSFGSSTSGIWANDVNQIATATGTGS
jgi:pilus assembly protein Flp/PilA